MATINTQTNLDALITSNRSNYVDTDTNIGEAAGITIGGLDFTSTTNTITANPGFVINTPSLKSFVQSDVIMDNCIINMYASAPGQDWQRGAFRAKGAQLVYTKTPDATPPTNDDNCQWPGFKVIDVNNRPTYDLENATIRAYNDARLTNHFGNMSPTGNNFNGLTFEYGALFIPFGSVVLSNIKFSDTPINSTGTALDVYTRIQQFTNGTTLTTAKFSGMYDCDLTNWTGFSTRVGIVFQVRTNQTATDYGFGTFYLCDNQYSSDFINNSLPIHISNSVANRSINVYSGQSWNPSWYNRASIVNIEDVKYNIGDRSVHFMKATDDNTVNPLVQTPTSSNNFVTYYNSGIRRPGVFIQNDFTQLIPSAASAISNINVDISTISDIPYWTYTNVCYDTDGKILKRNTIPSIFTGDMVLDNNNTDVVELELEGAKLNGKTLAEAQIIYAADINNIDDFYPAAKAFSYDNNIEDISYSASGDTFNSSNLVFSTTNSQSATQTTLKIGSNLTGGSTINRLSGTSFSATKSVIIDNTIFNFTGITNLTNISLDNNVSFDSGTYTNISAVINNILFLNDPIIDLTTGDIKTITNSSGDVTFNLDSGTATVNRGIGFTGIISTSGAGTITVVEDSSTTIQIDSLVPTSFFVAKRLDSDVIINQGLHTTGVDTLVHIYDNDSTNIIPVKLWVLPISIQTGNSETSIDYRVATSTFDNNSGFNRTVAFTNSNVKEFSDLLTGLSEEANIGTSNIAFGYTGVTETTATLDVTNATNQGGLTAAATLRLLLNSREDVFTGSTFSSYLHMLALNNLDNDIIEPTTIGTQINTDYLTLSALVQSYLTSISLTGTGTAIAKLPAPNEAIDSVIIQSPQSGATPEQIVFEINNSKVARGVGYTVKQLDDLAIESNFDKETPYENDL